MADRSLAALADFEASLVQSGMDITQRFDTAWYNDYVAEESLPLRPLPTCGRASAMAILIGNTSALWPAFLAWLGTQPDAESVVDPLDTYTDRAIHRAVEQLLVAVSHTVPSPQSDADTGQRVAWSSPGAVQQQRRV